MSNLKFTPNPTFKIDVSIPVAGQDEAGVLTITFRHLKPSEWQEIYSRSVEKMTAAVNGDKPDPDGQRSAMVEALKAIIHSWAWKEEFNEENISATIENYPAFYATVMQSYGEELWKVRVKN